MLRARSFGTCAALDLASDRRRVSVAGLVLVRQKPGSAKGVMLVTLEDEGGIANVVIYPKLFEQARRTILTARLLGVRGRAQRDGPVVHVIAERLEDLSTSKNPVDVRWRDDLERSPALKAVCLGAAAVFRPRLVACRPAM